MIATIAKHFFSSLMVPDLELRPVQKSQFNSSVGTARLWDS